MLSLDFFNRLFKSNLLCLLFNKCMCFVRCVVCLQTGHILAVLDCVVCMFAVEVTTAVVLDETGGRVLTVH